MIDSELLLKQWGGPSYQKETWAQFYCYKHPTLNLVFFPHQKCASTTYRQLFDKLEWDHIDIREINWTKDKVFGTIRNPLVRHRKGIIEGICNYFPEVKEYFLTPTGAKFLTNITIVEAHSYSILHWFGPHNATKVHWIPIDTDINHKQMTFDFLESNGVDLSTQLKEWFLNVNNRNESTEDELKLFEMMMSHKTPGEILRYLDFDTCLYNMILASRGFEPDNYKDRIKELTAQGLSNLEAEKIADAEVESGEYLQWKKELNC